jgi:hypothetical protein
MEEIFGELAPEDDCEVESDDDDEDLSARSPNERFLLEI